MRRVFALTTLPERVVFGALLAGYVVLALLLWQGRDFSRTGTLSFGQPDWPDARLAALQTNRAGVEQACFGGAALEGNRLKIVAGVVGGRQLFACYDADSDGSVWDAEVVDGAGRQVRAVRVLKQAGVWPNYGLVKSSNDFVVGGIGLAALLGFGFYVATRPRRPPQPVGSPWWGHGLVLGSLASASVVGWVVIASLRRVPRARKARFVTWGAAGWTLVLGYYLANEALSKHDPWGIAVVSYIGGASLAAVGLGVRARPRLLGPPRSAPTRYGRTATAGASWGRPSPAADVRAAVPAVPTPIRVQRAGTLPTFAAVGGLVDVKAELRDTITLVLAFSEHANAYRVSWNGILLHGRPGTGKTFLARATAGELGLNFLQVAAGDLVSSFRGESARNVEAVFRQAVENIPALLFFDEFDSIAARRDGSADQETRHTVNQLLQSLEAARPVRELIVMAATNDLGSLDPAVIRPGRFDRHIHQPLPDYAARRAILLAQLEGRPGAAGMDVSELARRTEGLTPAALAQIVSGASVQAMREAARSPTGALVPLTTARVLEALAARGGQDRPTVENWGWDRLILPAKVKAELRQLAALAAEPDRAARFGTEPPSGVLLYGPPGTGKSTIARVLAAQSACSFYPVSAAEVTSMWLGESERLISRLFERARENRPSIVFIDEIDAVASARGGWGTYDRQVNQLLQEIDGVEPARGLVVIGATNRKEALDSALLRGGRLSRHIEIPLPDVGARRDMLRLFTAGMPIRSVDLDELAARTEDLSGADLRALCQQAALEAILRQGEACFPAITAVDFEAALVASHGEHERALAAGSSRRREDARGYV